MMRESTWSSLGVEASDNNLDVLLREANLDYNAVKRDLYVEAGDGTQILVPNKKMVVREDTNELFGIVSDRYQICQNRDALDFVRFIDDIKLQRAGSLVNNPGSVYLIGQLPEVEILGDKINPNIIFQNSHDGSCAVRATICMLRIVCQNQFISAFKNSPATIRVSHQGDVDKKLLVAQQTMVQTHEYISTFEATALDMASKKVTPKIFNEILDTFFKKDEEYSNRRNEKIEFDRERFIKAYQEDDNSNFTGTQWGLVNAYSDYLTHYEPLRMTENYAEQRFLWNLNSSYMDKFIDVVESIAA